jgi:hypothetical protein
LIRNTVLSVPLSPYTRCDVTRAFYKFSKTSRKANRKYTHKSRTVQYSSDNSTNETSAIQLTHICRNRDERISYWRSLVNHIYKRTISKRRRHEQEPHIRLRFQLIFQDYQLLSQTNISKPHLRYTTQQIDIEKNKKTLEFSNLKHSNNSGLSLCESISTAHKFNHSYANTMSDCLQSMIPSKTPRNEINNSLPLLQISNTGYTILSVLYHFRE